MLGTRKVCLHLQRATLPVQRDLGFKPSWLSTGAVCAAKHRFAQSLQGFHLDVDIDGEAAPEFSCLIARPGDAVDLARGKNQQLHALLQKMRHPRMTSFHWRGREYGLPYSRKDIVVQALPQAARTRMRYLAGFFDGDGCVECQVDLSGCKLSIGQSIKQPGVLLLFLDTFGGSVVRHSDGFGLRLPVLRWVITGSAAGRAACLLASHSIAKKRQLLLAAAWPQDTYLRERHQKELGALKRYDSAIAHHCTAEYLTGFFDADGHVQHRGGTRLALWVCQKHVTVLECLKRCFREHLNVDAQVRTYKLRSALYLTRTSACKAVLRAMLESGLQCKAEQAKLAIALTKQNAPQVRAKLADMVGFQGWRSRLDEAGLQRAFAIEAARQMAVRLQRRGSISEAHSKLDELDELKSEHKLLNACHVNSKLHGYIVEITKMGGPLKRPQPRGIMSCMRQVLISWLLV